MHSVTMMEERTTEATAPAPASAEASVALRDAQPARYGMLTAWRGLAAAGVVLHHIGDTDLGIRTGRVMLFFVISGYGIAASTESTLARGTGAWEFFARRVRRIWPPYVLSIVYLLVMALAGLVAGGIERFERPIGVWVRNLTLTSWVTMLDRPRPHAFQSRDPVLSIYWSLGYEAQFYALAAMLVGVGALVERRRERAGKKAIQIGFAAALAVGLAWMLAFPRMCYGPLTDYLAVFALGGVVHYRLNHAPLGWSRRAIDAGLVALVGVSAWAAHVGPTQPPAGRDPTVRLLGNEMLIASAFALALVALYPLNRWWDSWKWTRPLDWLGKISFSLFLVHIINRELAAQLAGRMLPGNAPHWLELGVQLTMHIGLALPFWWLCERPFARRAGRPSQTE